jgi:hypothetical protein
MHMKANGKSRLAPPTMKLLSVLALVLLPAAIIPAQFHSAAPKYDSDSRNLFTNGDFEKGAAGWELLNWGKDGRMEMDPSEFHDGKPTLRVDNSQPSHSFIRQIVMGKPHTRYRLSGYIKTRDVESEPNGQKSGAVLMVGRMAVYTPLLAGTTPWTAVSVEFATKDDPEIRLGPSLGTDPTFPTGTAWFSGLRLIELGGVDEIIPVPERAKTFLDPVETLLRGAPGDALQKLQDSSTAPEAAVELNRYFANYALNKSIVLHTTVEAAQAQPDVRNGFRIGAASTPLVLDGVTLKRLSWLYFQQSHSAEANSVKVGSDITVTGWIRRCEVVMTPDGPRLNFDLQHTRIISASMPLPAPGGLSLNEAAKPATVPVSAGSADLIKSYTRAGYPVIDLRQELADTSWRATPGQAVRPGLVALLTFNGKDVDPAGYRYEANAHDSTVTIFFNHGDTQVMLLTDQGKCLRFTFGGRDYTYDLVPK